MGTSSQRTSKPSIIALANKHVRIEQAARWAGARVPDIDAGSSAKIHCPFGELYHPDGGREPAFRVYPGPNNAWCFACGDFYTPVSLCAAAWEQHPESVAVELLQRVGYKPVTFAQHWQEAVSGTPPNRDSAEQALQIWLSRFPSWRELQYHPDVSSYLAQCLGLLAMARTEDDCKAWLAGAKQVMEQVIRKVETGGSA